jgi:TolB protein
MVMRVAGAYAAGMTRRSARLAAMLIVGCTAAWVAVRSAPATSTALRGPSQEVAPLLAFTGVQKGDTEIHVIRADGTGHRVLTHNRLNDRIGAWSPDGRWLAYVLLNRRGVGAYYAREVDGPGFVRIGGMLSGYEWSPDGRRVLTQHKISDDLKVVDLTSGARREVDYGGGLLEGFGWSPDGTKIVFATDRYFGTPKVFVANADATGRRRLVRDGTTPAWSPDGRWIAFLHDVGIRYSTVYVVRPDGTGLRRLSPTRISGVDQWGWAPDGRKLAISQYLRTPPNRLGVLDVEHGGVRWLSEGRRYGGRFQWTPDGKRILFLCGPYYAYSLCLADVATARVRKVTRRVPAGEVFELSPDGQKASFTNDKGVYVLELPTGKLRHVTASGYFLSWSPDGEWIAVQLKAGLHVIRLRDAFVRRIARTFDGYPAWQPRAS